MDLTNLSPRLKGARESIGMTEEQVSKDTGIPREMISYWESGVRAPPAHSLGRLARYYGLNIAWFTEPAMPVIKVATRRRDLSDHDREVIYWARLILTDYLAMKSAEGEGRPVMVRLPAHRGLEFAASYRENLVSQGILASAQAPVFDEAFGRVLAKQGILVAYVRMSTWTQNLLPSC